MASFRFASDRQALETAAGRDFVKAYQAMARLKFIDMELRPGFKIQRKEWNSAGNTWKWTLEMNNENTQLAALATTRGLLIGLPAGYPLSTVLTKVDWSIGSCAEERHEESARQARLAGPANNSSLRLSFHALNL